MLSRRFNLWWTTGQSAVSRGETSETGLKHVPNGREERKTARDGTPEPLKKKGNSQGFGTPGPTTAEPAIRQIASWKERRCWKRDARDAEVQLGYGDAEVVENLGKQCRNASDRGKGNFSSISQGGQQQHSEGVVHATGKQRLAVCL